MNAERKEKILKEKQAKADKKAAIKAAKIAAKLAKKASKTVKKIKNNEPVTVEVKVEQGRTKIDVM